MKTIYLREPVKWNHLAGFALMVAAVGVVFYDGHEEVAMASSKTELAIGAPAPDVALLNDEGKTVRISDFRGQKVVLYFYPKDDTPGCTKEACAFRDGTAELKKRGAVVLGVSIDPVDSHQKFKRKFSLNFPLLADVDKQAVEAYGVWKEKSMYGKTFLGIERTTFLIDEQGRIARIFPKVKVDEHFDEVIAAIDALKH